jgi:hypothetical protein
MILAKAYTTLNFPFYINKFFIINKGVILTKHWEKFVFVDIYIKFMD